MTTKTLEQNMADNIVHGAFEFLAEKAGVSASEIMSAIMNDPTGNVAQRAAELIVSGIKNADSIIQQAKQIHAAA